MNAQPPDFPLAFAEIETPEPIITSRLDTHIIKRAENTFFRAVMTSLNLQYRTVAHQFEYTSMLPGAKHEIEGSPEVGDRSYDMMMRVFRRRGGQALASVLHVYGGDAFERAYFQKYPVQPETILAVRDLREIERFEFGLG